MSLSWSPERRFMGVEASWSGARLLLFDVRATTRHATRTYLVDEGLPEAERWLRSSASDGWRMLGHQFSVWPHSDGFTIRHDEL